MMGSLKISHTNVQLKLNSPALFITCASIMCALGSECHTLKIWTIACSVFYRLYHVICMSFNYQTQFSPEFKCTFENRTIHNQTHFYHLNTRLAWYLNPTLCPFLWYSYHMESILRNSKPSWFKNEKDTVSKLATVVLSVLQPYIKITIWIPIML